MSKQIRILIQLIFGLALLFIWLRFVEWDLLLSYLSRVDLRYVGIVFLFGLVTTFLRLTRLKIVLTPLVKVPILPLYAIGLASSFFNFLLAMRAGELAKGYYLKKLYGSSFVRATSAVVVDRVADFLILVFVVLAIGLFGKANLISPILLAAIFIISLATLYLLAWEGVRIFSLLESLMLRLDFPYRERILPILNNLIKGFAVAKRSPRMLFLIFFLSFLPVIIGGIGMTFILKAFSVEVSFLSAILANSLLGLFFVVPSPPAYIGTIEVAGSAIFILALGLDKNLAASIALFHHAYSAFLAGIMGLPAVLWLHSKIIRR